jgi:hemerythrin
MPLVRWNRSFELGVYVFDAEHMQVLALVNDLYDAILGGLSEGALNAVQSGMRNFIERHSAHEEEFFHVSGYRDAEAHIAEHRRLAHEIDEIRQSHADLAEATYDTNRLLLRWFFEHIMERDRAFCVHLRKLGVR